MAENKNAQQTSLITKKDVRKSFILWHAFAETSLNFERLQALAFCNSLTGILKKLYPNKEDLSAALQRHRQLLVIFIHLYKKNIPLCCHNGYSL